MLWQLHNYTTKVKYDSGVLLWCQTGCARLIHEYCDVAWILKIVTIGINNLYYEKNTHLNGSLNILCTGAFEVPHLFCNKMPFCQRSCLPIPSSKMQNVHLSIKVTSHRKTSSVLSHSKMSYCQMSYFTIPSSKIQNICIKITEKNSGLVDLTHIEAPYVLQQDALLPNAPSDHFIKYSNQKISDHLLRWLSHK